MSEIQLYDYPISGNCYKVRLLLSMLGLDYERIQTDFIAGETLTPAFKRLNPRGQLPVLVDDGEVIWDSMAILYYLAHRYGNGEWLPHDLMGEVHLMQWLAVSENEMLYGLARARAIKMLGRPFNLEQSQQHGRDGLAAMETQLAQTPWLCGEGPTIADIACYPYTALAYIGEVSLAPYPAVRAWLAHFEALPGWVSLTA